MRINLLPPEVLERQRTRRRTVMVFGAGLLVLVVLAGFYLVQVFTLQGVEDDIQTQQDINAQLEAEIASLQDIAALEQEIERTRTVLSGLLVDRVLWSGILRDISLVIPGEVWLSGLSAQLGVTATDETGAPVAGGVVGQISFNGFAFDHRDVALWLSRLEDVRGFVNPWLSSSSKTAVGTQDAVTFTSSVDLSEQAVARRGDTP
jgi:Tfp pilus assembly protein PilN